MCLYPKIIKNKKYLINKKNGGNIPQMKDERVQYVPVGCGKCIECRKQEARKWQVRLTEEIKTQKNGHFITLTFNNNSIAKLTEIIKKDYENNIDGYDLDNEIATYAIRYFLERWRKKYKKSVRHWMVTELGHNGTENIHMHGIIWTNETKEKIEKIWNYGFIWDGYEDKKTYVNEITVNYIIGYINKIDPTHKYYKPKVLTSKGIGANYLKSYNSKLNKFNGEQTKETYKTQTGHDINLPIYYRNHIYTEEQREQLWLIKLDKNERWICGVKIKADDQETYNQLLKYHQIRNKRLGYGNDEKNWDRFQYERQRRNIQNAKRIQKANTQAGQSAKRKAAGRAGNASGGAAP